MQIQEAVTQVFHNPRDYIQVETHR